MTLILETPRLTLREMVSTDLDFVAEMLGDEDVSRFYPKPFTRADAQVWLDRQLTRYVDHGHGLWLAARRSDGVPVGQIGLARQEVDGASRPEIGWLLHRAHWGHGYATEGAAATRDAAFGRWDYPDVISLIRPVNVRSRRVAERIGMTAGRLVPFHGFEHMVFGTSRVPVRS